MNTGNFIHVLTMELHNSDVLTSPSSRTSQNSDENSKYIRNIDRSTFFCSILSSLKKNLLFFNLSLSIEYILCYIRTRVHIIIIIIIIIPFSLVWQDNIEKEIHCIFSYWLNSLYLILMKTFYSHQEILFL